MSNSTQPTIHAVKAFNDNYIWIIERSGQAIIIDAGDDEPVLQFLHEHELSPIAMLITHHHNDHTGGVAGIKQAYPDMQIIAHAKHGVSTTQVVDESDEIQFLGIDFRVWRTAGHTDTHLSYLCEMGGKTHVFCGDTLFSGGCGRVFTGTIDELYHSMMRFDDLPSDTLFYPAHEYTLANLQFGLTICAKDRQDAIKSAIISTKNLLNDGKISLPTTLEHERNINVFLQVNQPDNYKDMLNNINKIYPLSDETPLSAFAALRELKNNFKG